MKRNYDGLDFSLILANSSSPILKGSLTSVPIKINEVVVEDFETGFGAGTPNDPSDDFKDITFD